MRRLTTIILSGLMVAQFAKADGRNIYVLSESGQLSIEAVDDIEYFTFAPEADWLTVSSSVDDPRANYADVTVKALPRTDIKSFPFAITVGIVLSHQNTMPEINGSKCYNVVLGDTVGNYSERLSAGTEGLGSYWQQNTTNYARAYIKYLDRVLYTDVMTFASPVENSKRIYYHDWIDLQLPSGTLWMDTNIGASTDADKGNRYQWARSMICSEYTEKTYLYYTYDESLSYYLPNKYNSTDGQTVISREKNASDADTYYDDVVESWMYSASGRDGSSYTYLNMYVPTKADFEELMNEENCTWTVKTKKGSDGNDVKGYEVRSKRNNSTIFLPLADNNETSYWTRQLNEESVAGGNYRIANCMTISEQQTKTEHAQRYLGLYVRGVYYPNKH